MYTGAANVAPIGRTRHCGNVVLKSILPQRLARLRSINGLSQAALARVSGIANSTISEIETGLARDIKLNTLLRICAVLNVTPDYLLGFDADTDLAHTFVVALDPLTVAESRSGIERKCSRCDRILRTGEPHTQGECVWYLDQRGSSREYLAAVFGFGLAAIDAIVRDEYERRRRHITADN